MSQTLSLVWMALAAAPGDLEESYRLGEQALAKGHLTEAEASFRQVLALQANDPGA